MRELGKCPICKGELIIKNGKYGDFIGCSNFPDCRYTEKIKCPKCGSIHIIEIVYGLVTSDSVDLNNPNIIYRGCRMTPSSPNYVCKDCKQEF